MSEYSFDAVIFDLDGVITDTASLHSQAWKQMFDEFLRAYAEKNGLPFREFTHAEDYLPYVDGKPRYQGVASFLESRGIDLPFGDPSDLPARESACGLGNRKNQLFNDLIKGGNIEVYSSTVEFIHELRTAGIRVGVASSSKNAETVLAAVGLLDLIETRIDGVVSAELGLMGKPEPDIFTTACDNLGVYYDRAVIVEDAISGVQAGQKGKFGLVLGIAREDNARELKLNGADIVVADMEEISFDDINAWFTGGLLKDQWSLSYDDYAPEKEGLRESLCTVGNGYFGTRGALEEAAANGTNYPGTYIAGVYNRLESEVAGRTILNEDLVNCPNWLPVTFKIGDGDWLDPNNVEIIEFSRKLNFRDGVLRREVTVIDKAGRETQIVSERLVSMAQPHLAALKYSLTPLNYSGAVSIRSGLDGNIVNAGVERYGQLNPQHLEPVSAGGQGAASYVVAQTNQSAIQIAEAARLKISVNGQQSNPQISLAESPGRIDSIFKLNARQGIPICVEKMVSIYTSKDTGIADPLRAAQEALNHTGGFDEVRRPSAAAWADIWQKVDIQIEGDRLAQKLLRLHLYHLMVTASPHNAGIDTGLPARGLHGEAYRGHIFWDELYVLPLYDMHFPEAAKSILQYRYRRLDQARASAQEHGYQGAMFPWQSGSDGSEETQVLHLNPLSGEWGVDHSSLQRHISLAVALNIWQYFWITNDGAFMETCGAEMFIEICRFWASKAVYNQVTGRYEIDKVMGPDEYHEKYPNSEAGGLKDNSYTNIMAVWMFGKAFEILAALNENARDALVEKIDLAEEELALWKDIITKINIPISDEGILEQYAGFFDLKELDWDGYRTKYGNIARLDRILKAEGKSPDEYKAAKQADVLMAFYNLTSDEVSRLLTEAGYSPPQDLLQVNFDYYLKRTSHGSTLSRLVHSYLANLIGDKELRWQLYMEALTSDYTDIQGGTTKEGIHAGVMGGTVMAALRAYAGLDLTGEQVKIAPNLPKGWRRMSFNIRFKGEEYRFVIGAEGVEAG